MTGKEFNFPRNVKKEYSVFKELTIKDIVKNVLPVAVIGIVICLLPPYNILFKIVEIMFLIIFITVIMALLVATPIKERPNIKITDTRKIGIQYKHMQKLYFLKPKATRRYINENDK